MTTGDRVKLATRRLPLPGDWRPVRHADGHKAARPRQRSGRQSFGSWRRSRPFLGGLLLVLGGLELLGIPLSGILSRGAVKLVVYIGIGGVFGVLIGILLITAGIAVWVNPEHRVFYGVAGVVLGIVSFPTSNLGGFFVCMLLAIVGGSIAFAWTLTPASPAVARSPGSPAVADSPTVPGEPPASELPETGSAESGS
jgi:hypothetical protein